MATEHEDPGLSSSLTDLMTSLAVIFILLLAGTMNNTAQQTKASRNLVLNQLEKVLRDFKAKGVKVESDPNDPLDLIVLIPEGLLRFEQDKATVPPPGYTFLESFIPRFVGAACGPALRDKISSIVIEGHTSPEGAESRNLPLSQERSMAVLKDSLDVIDSQHTGNDVPSQEHQCFVGFVSAAGRGSADPVYNKDGTVNYPDSRRVLFKIRIKSLEQREFTRQLGLAELHGTEH